MVKPASEDEQSDCRAHTSKITFYSLKTVNMKIHERKILTCFGASAE